MVTSTPIDLDPVLECRDYQFPLFVGRDDELETIKLKVQQVRAGSIIEEPVVNFWGVSGIGKTWLLHHLHNLYQYGGDSPTFALLYVFTEESITAPPSALAESLASQALKQLSPALPTKDQDSLVRARDSGNIRDLVVALSDLSRRFVPLILLDRAEKITPAAWQELEVHLIEPLAITGRTLIVIAGRRYVSRWHRFEVRRRVMEPSRTQIRSFEKAVVSDQINRYGYSIPVDQLFLYTAGNPYLVNAIAQNMLVWTDGMRLDRASFDRHRAGLLEILRAYEKELLENVSLDLQRVLHVVLPLRFYRLESLRFMLTKQEPEAAPQPDLYYLNILRSLEKQTEVVWWNREWRAYITDEMVRKVMNRRQLLENRAEYLKGHRLALSLNWDWARQYREVSEEFIIEIWFHLSSIYLADQNLKQARSGVKEALTFSREHLSPGRLDVLHNQLSGDKELHEILPEVLLNELNRSLEQSLEYKEH